MKSGLMILFAKAPVPGRVKTRLTPVLSPEIAAKLHHLLVEVTWRKLELLCEIADAELHTDVPTDAWPAIPVSRLQVPGDLGARMFAAISGGLGRGFRRVVIIGGDCAPGLPEHCLRNLLQTNSDVAIGPSADGGYYAISCGKVHPLMFQNVRWSTRYALEDSVRSAEACGLSVETVESWFDIDEPADLDRLKAYPAFSALIDL